MKTEQLDVSVVTFSDFQAFLQRNPGNTEVEYIHHTVVPVDNSMEARAARLAVANLIASDAKFDRKKLLPAGTPLTIRSKCVGYTYLIPLGVVVNTLDPVYLANIDTVILLKTKYCSSQDLNYKHFVLTELGCREIWLCDLVQSLLYKNNINTGLCKIERFSLNEFFQ